MLRLCLLLAVVAIPSWGQLSRPSDEFTVSDAVLDVAIRINDASDHTGNSVFSPLGLSTALNMLLLGSAGSTRDQIRSFLSYPEWTSDSQIHKAFSDTLARVNKKTDSAELKIANALITQRGLGLDKNYTLSAKSLYESETGTLDFTSDSENAMKKINAWASEKTNKKIPSLLTRPLPASTTMVLLNAIYFKGAWDTPFPVQQTRKGDFFVSSGNSIEVDFMANVLTVPYAESKELDCKAIVLPYLDKQYGMMFLLPNGNGAQAVESLEKKMTQEALDKIMLEDMNLRLAVVHIPKFKIRQSMNLRPALSRTGASGVFEANADFSKINKDAARVDDVLHQAYIEVNEEGTEAAAATGITLSRDAPSKQFIANKPFAFIIRQNNLNLSLFHGRVTRPQF